MYNFSIPESIPEPFNNNDCMVGYLLKKKKQSSNTYNYNLNNLYKKNRFKGARAQEIGLKSTYHLKI